MIQEIIFELRLKQDIKLFRAIKVNLKMEHLVNTISKIASSEIIGNSSLRFENIDRPSVGKSVLLPYYYYTSDIKKYSLLNKINVTV